MHHATVTVLDTDSNLVAVGGPGVNMITWHYNNLLDAAGNHTLKAYFEKDDVGVDRIHVAPSGRNYYIEYDVESRKTADYAIIELYHDEVCGRWVLIVAGLGGEGTWAAAKVLSTYEDWSLSGMAAVVKYYDSDGDGYLDVIAIVETIEAPFTGDSSSTSSVPSSNVEAPTVGIPPLMANVALTICFASLTLLSVGAYPKRKRKF